MDAREPTDGPQGGSDQHPDREDLPNRGVPTNQQTRRNGI